MNCPHCLREFSPKRSDQRYCRPKCRQEHYELIRGDGALRAPVRTVKLLAGGAVSVTIRFAAHDAAHACELLPGTVVEIVRPCS